MLGQTSFFLIGFFKHKNSAMKSSLKAFFFNRISDLTLLLAVIYIYMYTNDFTMSAIKLECCKFEIIVVLLSITALVKSAQSCFFF